MKCTFGKETPLGVLGDHDWALLEITWLNEHSVEKILWACPCGEFRWTSYAEWEQQASEPTVDTIADQQKEAS